MKEGQKEVMLFHILIVLAFKPLEYSLRYKLANVINISMLDNGQKISNQLLRCKGGYNLLLSQFGAAPI